MSATQIAQKAGFFSKCLRTAAFLQNSNNIRSFASAVAIEKDFEAEKPAWQLCASTCLIRLPLVEPKKQPIEQTFGDFMSHLEFEKSVLCDWELEKIKQNQQIADVEAGKVESRSLTFKFSNQEIEDGYDINLTKFKDTFKEIELDHSNIKDVNRKPEDTLVLITKQKLGGDYVWTLPMKSWKEGETLRETAENAISTCNSSLPAEFISNAPSTFYKYKIPKKARPGDSYLGVKLFIYSAFIPRNSYTRTTIDIGLMDDNNDDVVDYAWVASDELREYMKPKYGEIIRSILL